MSGTTGNTGSTGPIGPTGDMGPTGPTGLIGPTGSQGLIGPRGSQGQTGSTGVVGNTGPIGPKGYIGPTGLRGPTGQKGEKGQYGVAGLRGFTGFGVTGATGNTGSTGSTGSQGLKGPKGDQGFQGDVGHIGATGYTGNTGPIGVIGPTGQSQKGSTGSTGPTGPINPFQKYNLIAYADKVFAATDNADITNLTNALVSITNVFYGIQYLSPSQSSDPNALYNAIVIPLDGIYAITFGGWSNGQTAIKCRLRVMRIINDVNTVVYDQSVPIQTGNLGGIISHKFIWNGFLAHDRVTLYSTQNTTGTYPDTIVEAGVFKEFSNLTVEKIN